MPSTYLIISIALKTNSVDRLLHPLPTNQHWPAPITGYIEADQ